MMYLYGNLHQVSNLGDLDLIALCLLDCNILFVSLLLLIAVDAVMSKSIKVGTCNVHVVDQTCGVLSPLFKHTHCILAQRLAFHLHAHVFEGLTNCSEIVCVVLEEIVRRIHQQVCLLSLHPFLP